MNNGSLASDYEIAVSFKTSQGWSIYGWDNPIWADGDNNSAPNIFPTINWTTLGVSQNNGGGQGLSHATVYYRLDPTDPGNPDPVPEPSSMVLLAFGLVCVGLSRRKLTCK